MFYILLVRPLLEFLQPAKGEPINLLKWSPVHPTEVCVLSSSSHIHLWNLMENSVHPIQSYSFEDFKYVSPRLNHYHTVYKSQIHFSSCSKKL